MRYDFDPFVYDSDSHSLSRAGEAVALRPRALAALRILLEHRGRLVTKEMLIDAVWGGRVVTDAALTMTIADIRKALGENSGWVKTAYGEGFRFTGDIRVTGAAQVEGEKRARIAGDARPSIAVLPLRTLGEPAWRAVVAEGLADEVINALAKLRWMHVTARGSAFRFPSHAQSVAEVGEQLGVRYCLSGSLELSGERAIVGMELADTASEDIVWSDSFKMNLSDIIDAREDIARRVATAIDRAVPAHEIEGIYDYAPDKLEPWQNFHLGYTIVTGSFIDRFDTAGKHFAAALEKDRRFTRARAGLANCYFLEMMMRNEDAVACAHKARELAEQAYAQDPEDPYASLMQARLCFTFLDHAAGVDGLRRTLDLSPSHAIAWYDLARMLIVAGHADTAREAIDNATALSPFDPYRHTAHITEILIALAEGDAENAVLAADRDRQLAYRSVDDRIASLAAYDAGERASEATEEAGPIREILKGQDFESYLAVSAVTDPQLRDRLERLFHTYRLGDG